MNRPETNFPESDHPEFQLTGFVHPNEHPSVNPFQADLDLSEQRVNCLLQQLQFVASKLEQHGELGKASILRDLCVAHLRVVRGLVNGLTQAGEPGF